MKKIILSLLIVFISISAWGAKAYPLPVTITQKDGTSLTIQMSGDEYFSYHTTTDGILLCQQGTSYYIAIVNEKGELQPSTVLAHNAGQRTKEEIRLIGLQDQEPFFRIALANESKEARRREKILTDKIRFPHEGTPKALIILADFQDQKFKHYDETAADLGDAISIEIFDQYFNAKERPQHASDASLRRNTGSVSTYFKDMSFDKFSPQFDVKAVVHLSREMAYYGAGRNDKIGNLIPEVCTLAEEKGVDFSEYDSNNDGLVDLLYIIYAGYGQNVTGNSDETIWAKCGDGYTYGPYDGKKVQLYGVHSELNYNPEITKSKFEGVPQINGIGLFCHEFTHAMGLPDFYPTTSTAQAAGNNAMEYWDLMDCGEYTLNGGYRPTAYTAWEREALGWFTIDTLRTENKGEIILENIDKGGKAYRILNDEGDNHGSDYLILQNIQSYGWNLTLGRSYGHGMLITHVDYDEQAFTISGSGGNKVNNILNHSRMTIIPADSLLISSYLAGTDKKYSEQEYIASHGGDPYPGTSNVTEIPFFTMYASDGGTMKMEKPIYDISENTETGVVTFYYLISKEEAGIHYIYNDQETNGHYYTIDGYDAGTNRHQLRKGIYIYNHKKIVVK